MLVVVLVLNACIRDDSGDRSSASGDGSSSSLCTVDSSSDSGGSGVEIEYGSFEYEGQIYKTVAIGTQTWMAENLNYNALDSRCYGDSRCSSKRACPACIAVGSECTCNYVISSKCFCEYYNNDECFDYHVVITNSEAQANCDKYGRLYDWVTAMALDSSCYSINCANQISAKHKGICPSGWHIPTQSEWKTLLSYVENDKQCNSCAAKHLKTSSDWGSCGNGLDTYGFAALPGGMGMSSNTVVGNSVGSYGYWWSATEYGDKEAYFNFMFYGSEATHQDYFYKYRTLLRVRCVMD